jgi:hypothetical protein
MNGKATDVCMTVLRAGVRGQGYVVLGLGWEHPDGGWRLRCWAKRGAGRVGLFLPEGRGGAFVSGLRGVMIQVDPWPRLEGGGYWLLIWVPSGTQRVDVTASRGTVAGP